MALITYSDKATMNENSSIPAINKVQASDMNEIKSVVNSNATVEDFSSQVTIVGTPAHYSFKKMGNLVIISYQGPAQTNAAGTKLFTLPSGYRKNESGSVFFSTFTQNANTYGVLFQEQNGDVKVNQTSSGTNSGRVYFATSYFVG